MGRGIRFYSALAALLAGALPIHAETSTPVEIEVGELTIIMKIAGRRSTHTFPPMSQQGVMTINDAGDRMTLRTKGNALVFHPVCAEALDVENAAAELEDITADDLIGPSRVAWRGERQISGLTQENTIFPDSSNGYRGYYHQYNPDHEGYTTYVIRPTGPVEGAEPDTTDDPPPGERRDLDPELRRETLTIIADMLGVPRAEAERYVSIPHDVAATKQTDGDPADPERSIEANMLLDASGRLLPAETHGPSARVRVARAENADHPCADPDERLPDAVHRLQIEVISPALSGRNTATIKLVDADTNLVAHQHKAEVDAAGREARSRAINQGYAGVGAPVTGRHP